MQNVCCCFCFRHISSYVIIFHHISSYIIIYHHSSSYIIIYHHISSHIIIYHRHVNMSEYKCAMYTLHFVLFTFWLFNIAVGIHLFQ